MLGKIIMPDVFRPRIPVIDQINQYAMSKGLTRKNGAYYKDNRFYGSMYDVGREANIDMQEGK